MVVKTENLILRTVSHEDIEEVARTWNFKKDGVTKEEAIKAIDWMEKTRSMNHLHHIAHICFAVQEENSNQIIGWCGLDGGSGSNKNKNKIHIFYMIDENYRNKGYATICANGLLEYGFMEMKTERIDGSCSKSNIASKRVLEKIGMKHMVIKDDGSPEYYLTRAEYIDYISKSN